MSYGIFNYENDEIGTCMMLIYDLEEQNSQVKNNSIANNAKGSGYKLESDYSIKSKNSEETTNKKQRPMSGMSYQKRANDTNTGLSNSKQSDYNFFSTPQQFNGGVAANQNMPLVQSQNSGNSNRINSNNDNNYNGNIYSQSAQSMSQPTNQNMGYQNGNQYFQGQRGQNNGQQNQSQQQQHYGMSQQQNESSNQYQMFARMMKDMDEETVKNFMAQYSMEQQYAKPKNNFL